MSGLENCLPSIRAWAENLQVWEKQYLVIYPNRGITKSKVNYSRSINEVMKQNVFTKNTKLMCGCKAIINFPCFLDLENHQVLSVSDIRF